MTLLKKGILGIIGIFVAVGVLAILIIVVQRPSSRALPSITTSGTVELSPAAVRLDALIDAVLAGTDPARCLEAGTPTVVDQCFATLAEALADTSLCERIGDPTNQESCKENRTLAQVRETGNGEPCLALHDALIRQACMFIAVDNGANESFCQRFSVEERALCLDRIHLLSGVQGDASACANITSDELHEECLSARARGAGGAEPTPPPSPSPDTDGDGLTDDEEATLGTNHRERDTDSDELGDFAEVRTYATDPRNPDTDGDSFTDGMEVRNGYNPKGPGRL